MNLERNDGTKRMLLWAFLCLGLAALLMVIILFVEGLAPFGGESLASHDANMDYIDFFAYLKDVLEGKNSPFFSFSKGLGGNMVAVLTTGYVSPLNLIILLFDKIELNAFFDIVVAAKIALSSFAMAVFLQIRFRNSLSKFFVVLFSLAYAFSQYNISQASNIFFLEGAYMLPLFLAGTYLIVVKETPYLLMLSVAYNVLFSWYTAGINCIFTVIWFLFELGWQALDTKTNLKEAVRKTGIAAFAGVTGVLLGGIFFMPTIAALQKGNEGTLNFELFKTGFSFTGNPITVLTNYYCGAFSNADRVSLFCGSIVFLGCIGFFIDKRYSFRQKELVGGLLAFNILSYYWKPLFLLFSLFKAAESFWFRYSYLGVFSIIVIAALHFKDWNRINVSQNCYYGIALTYTVLVLMFYNGQSSYDMTSIFLTILCLWALSFLATNIQIAGLRKAVLIGVLVISVGELFVNAHILWRFFRWYDIDHRYKQYIAEGQMQINEIHERDHSNYRIVQTKTRGSSPGYLTATYDEPAQFNYWSITAYTSCPDDIQRIFLDKVGYRLNGEDIYIANTCILPVDSLLGVKYVLSPYIINGLTDQDSYGVYNGKQTFVNPFALPMAFCVDDLQNTKDAANPFLYQNEIYSSLLNEPIELFKPVSYEKEEIGTDIIYRLKIKDKDIALYGNLPWDFKAEESIFAEDVFLTEYAKWLSPSVFYIPSFGSDVNLTVKSAAGPSVTEEQFYALDLKAFSEIIERLKAGSVEKSIIKNGYAEFEATGDDKKYLVTSIAYDKDWNIVRNGEEIEPRLVADCLMAVPLMPGKNHIEMYYRASGIISGFVCTIWGIALAVLYAFVKKRKNGRPLN